MLYGIVLWRYRNLIPLMLGLVITISVLQYGNGILHPVGPEYFEHTPPALIVALPKLVFARNGAVMPHPKRSCQYTTYRWY